jgi:uncharacterized protein (DUF697 family)
MLDHRRFDARLTREDAQMVDERTELVTTVAAPAGSETAEISDARRDELAAKLVNRFSLYSSAAGLIAVPALDFAAVCGLQIQMLRRLSQIYGVPFSENLGKSVLAGFAGSAIPATTAVGAGSALKTLPVLGTSVGAVTMAAGAAGATYLIGSIFIRHFASGGTLLDFDLSDYQEPLKTHADKIKVHSGRLKDQTEIATKRLKVAFGKLKSDFWPSPTPAASQPAAAPAQPAALTKEAG